MRHRLLATLTAIGLLHGPIEGQEVLFRAGLSVAVHFLNVDYGDPRVKGQAVVLHGEPLDVVIAIVNSLRGPTAAAETDWLERISVTLVRGGRFADHPTQIARLPCESRAALLRSQGATPRTDYVVLDASGGAQEFRCRFDAHEFALEAGTYTIKAHWIDRAIASSPLRVVYASLAPAAIELEVRDVRSPADALDRDLHLAHRALEEGRLEEAETLADEIVSRAPYSSPAYYLRGRLHSERGRCHQARADWHQSALIIERGSDVGNHHLVRLSQEQRARAAAARRQQAGQLPCR